jgi:hypothetical protein
MRSLKRLTKKRWASFAFAQILFIATLIGIAPAQAANCSPSSAPNTSNSAITVLTFTTVTTCDWQVPAGVTEISLVVVGGGGGGGGDAAGGGGGGGMYLNTNYSVTPGNTISVKVGAGGIGGQCSPGNAGSCSGGYIAPTNGADSFFGIITTPGGGKGGVYNNGSGGNGGSGGGGGGSSGTGGSKTVSGANYFGNNGGTGNGSAGGAGGGGAGAVGTSTSPGAGGDGKATSITGTQIYLAGGGGGGSSGGQVSGGLGGGGAGSASCSYPFALGTDSSQAQSGSASTGGGGGGAPWGCPGSGGSGGSGIVILSYLQNVATTISIALTGSLRSAIYRTASVIEATVTGANGKVRFIQNGKVIPGCAAIQSVSLVARCSWKPSNRGTIKLSAKLTPASAGFQISNSSILDIAVSNRTVKR